jgi:hypothetical protein
MVVPSIIRIVTEIPLEVINYNNVRNIKYGAFTNCTSLTSIIIPDTLPCIANWVFVQSNNQPHITSQKYVTGIIKCCFEGCSSLTSIKIRDSVTSIVKEPLSGASDS